MNDFNPIKALIGAVCIGALLTLFMALFDRWDAKQHPEHITRIAYKENGHGR